MKSLMVVLGTTEENARKAVEVCESKGSKENIVKAYEAAFNKLVAKKPEVEIEVYTADKYSRAEFKDPTVAMPHGNEGQPKQIVNEYVAKDDLMAGAEQVDLSDADLPF